MTEQRANNRNFCSRIATPSQPDAGSHSRGTPGQTEVKTYTTDHLRVLDPQGQHILSVMPIPAGNIVAQHIANLLTQSDATNTTTMIIGDSQDTVTAVLTGEYAGELAERIDALLHHAAGMDTETIANLGYTLLESMQAVERLDAVNNRLMKRAVQLACALEKMIAVYQGRLTASEITEAFNHARKALQQ